MYKLPADTRFDVEKASKAIKKIQSFKLGSEPIKLIPWQTELMEQLFGVFKVEDDRRYYRDLFLFLPTKNGKTTIASTLCLYFLLDPQIQIGEIYSAAPTKEQAARAYETMKEIIKRDDFLGKLLKCNDNLKRITNLKTGTYYRALSSDAEYQEGLNADFILVDELHAFKGRKLWDTLRNRQGAKKEPLFITITTAGPRPDPNSVCYQQYELAKKVRDGIIEVPGMLPMVFEASAEDDPFAEETWHKANPSLGPVKQLDEMRRRAAEARTSSLVLRAFQRYDLNLWVDTEEGFVNMESWNSCGEAFDIESLKGRECIAGLDLSSNIDLTSLALLFKMDDGTYRALSYSWVPKAIIADREEKDRIPYRTWASQGKLLTTSGETIDQHVIKAKILECAQLYKLKVLGVDWHMAANLCNELQNHEGLKLLRVGQGYNLSPALRELDRLIQSRRIKHRGQTEDPVLSWCMSNLRVDEGSKGDLKPIKDKSRHRIDAAVALTTAIYAALDVGRSEQVSDSTDSVYQSRGIILL